MAVSSGSIIITGALTAALFAGATGTATAEDGTGATDPANPLVFAPAPVTPIVAAVPGRGNAERGNVERADSTSAAPTVAFGHMIGSAYAVLVRNGAPGENGDGGCR